MNAVERIVHLVRHGETDWNVERRMLSRTNIPLNKRGRQQAQTVASNLAKIPIDIIVSSDLSRSIETAEIIRGNRPIQIITTPAVREKDYGVLEGLTVAKVVAMNLEPPDQSWDQRFAAKPHLSMESDQEVSARTLGYLAERLNEYASILVVTHSGVIRSLLLATHYTDYESLSHGAIGNCAHAVLSILNEQFTFLELSGIALKD